MIRRQEGITVKTQPEDDKTHMEAKSVLENVEQRNAGEAAAVTPAPKHKHRLLVTLGVVVALLVLAPLFVAAWFGFVPGLSNVLGARTPRDLGVTWSAVDLASYKSKTGTNFLDFANAPVNPTDATKKTIFTDPKTVQDLQLTQAEITAAINSLNWAWLPATNVQVRLGSGTIEISGNLKLDHAVDFARFIGGVGYSESDVQKATDWGMRFANGSAFYAKGTASVANNMLTYSLQDVRIGRFSVPNGVASRVVYTGGSNGMHNTKYLDVKSATVEPGKLLFSGTYPSTIYVKH